MVVQVQLYPLRLISSIMEQIYFFWSFPPMVAKFGCQFSPEPHTAVRKSDVLFDQFKVIGFIKRQRMESHPEHLNFERPRSQSPTQNTGIHRQKEGGAWPGRGTTEVQTKRWQGSWVGTRQDFSMVRSLEPGALCTAFSVSLLFSSSLLSRAGPAPLISAPIHVSASSLKSSLSSCLFRLLYPSPTPSLSLSPSS